MRCPNCSATLPITAGAVHYCPACGHKQSAHQLPDIYPWSIKPTFVRGTTLTALCLYHAETCDRCVIVATVPDRRVLAVTIALTRHIDRYRGRLSPNLISDRVSRERDELIAAAGVIHGR